jgi:hypothetical protein
MINKNNFLLSLNINLLHSVFNYLEYKEILKLSETSKLFNDIMNN